jgi:hypothetical protein
MYIQPPNHDATRHAQSGVAHCQTSPQTGTYWLFMVTSSIHTFFDSHLLRLTPIRLYYIASFAIHIDSLEIGINKTIVVVVDIIQGPAGGFNFRSFDSVVPSFQKLFTFLTSILARGTRQVAHNIKRGVVQHQKELQEKAHRRWKGSQHRLHEHTNPNPGSGQGTGVYSRRRNTRRCSHRGAQRRERDACDLAKVTSDGILVIVIGRRR